MKIDIYKGMLSRYEFNKYIMSIIEEGNPSIHFRMIPEMFLVDGIRQIDILKYMQAYSSEISRQSGIYNHLVRHISKCQRQLDSLLKNKKVRGDNVLKTLRRMCAENNGVLRIQKIGKNKYQEIHDFVKRESLKRRGYKGFQRLISDNDVGVYRLDLDLADCMDSYSFSEFSSEVTGREGLSHKLLKYLAKTTLERSGFSSVGYEVTASVGGRVMRFDLFDNRLALPIECGENNTQKLAHLFNGNDFNSLMFIPYQNELDGKRVIRCVRIENDRPVDFELDYFPCSLRCFLVVKRH